jgi:LacI family transcriptional regulator
MSLSIKQIASLAGVSRGTVDRALNGRDGISPLVRQRVLQIAAENGYRSNRAGKMLGIRKKPMKIGIQMPSIGNDFFRDVQAGLDQAEHELADFGLSLMIRTMKGFSAKTQIAQVRQMLSEGISALALVPIDSPDVAALLTELTLAGFPVMTFNTDLDGGTHLGYVGNDYDHSGAIAAGLLGLIADDRPFATLVITGSSLILGHNQRVTGFRRIIRQRYPAIRILDMFENQDDEEISHQLMLEALEKWPELDAVFLAAGGVAGACRALGEHQAGNPAGHAVKVVCFDQTPGTLAYQRTGLITASIGQEPFRQGYLPVKFLFEYLLDGTPPPHCTLTRNFIVIREHLDASEQPDSSDYTAV